MALALLTAGVSAWGQDSEADKAQTLLQKGVDQYKSKEFAKSQETLLTVKREKLTPAGQKELDTYLGNVRDAAKKSAAATEAYEEAQKAYSQGRFDQAKSLFDQVAASEYIPDPIRRDARTSAVLAAHKAQAGKAAAPASTPAPEAAAAPAASQSSETADLKAILAKDTTPPAATAAQADENVPAKATADVAAAAPDAVAPAAPTESTPAPTAPAPAETPAPVAAAPAAPDASAQTPAAAPAAVEAAPVAPMAAEPAATPEAPAAMASPETPATTAPVEAAVPTTEAASAPALAEAASASQSAPAAAASGPSPVETPELAELQHRIDVAKLLISDGNAALDRGDLDEALTKLGQAAKMAPEYEPARVALARAQALTPQSEGESAISTLQQQMSVRKQEVEVAYAQNAQQARLAIASPRSGDDFVQARNLAQNAKFLLTQNKSLFTDSEYRDKMVQSDNLVNFIAAEQDRWDKTQLAKQVREHEEQDRTRRLETQRQQNEKIDTLKARARALVKEQKYDQAVEVVDRIRKLAPDDQWAAEQYEMLNGFVQLRRDKQYYKQGLEEEQKQLIGIREAQIPWYELLQYPKDWPEISQKRLQQNEQGSWESDADRQIRKRLMQVQRKLEFPGIPFEQAVEFMRDVSGVSIDVKWTALETAGVSKETPVTLKLENVTTKKALRTMLDDVGGVNPLDYVVSDGVITISTREDLAKVVFTHVYDIRDLILRVPNFAAPAMNLSSGGSGSTGSTGSSGGGGSVGMSTSGSGSVGGSSGGSGSGSSSGSSGSSGSGGSANEVDSMSKQQLTDSILDLIHASIDPASWSDRQGAAATGVGSVRQLNGQIIVTQTPENHRALIELLAKLREAQALQVSVEARFIQVSTGFLNNIGIDLDFFFNTGSTTKATGTLDPITGARILGTGPGAALPQWNGLPGNSNWTAIPITQGSSAFTTPGQTSVPNSIGSTATSSALNIAGTFLDDIQVDFLVNATQANQTSRSLTAPRLTLFNGQRAYVAVTRTQSYVSGVTPSTSNGGTVVGGVVVSQTIYTPNVTQITTGTTLEVEATISNDHRYVSMTVFPQVTSLDGFDEYQNQRDASGRPIPGSGTISLPRQTTEAVQCTVQVPDGGTLLLGGQRLAGEVEKEMGVPGLSKIPVLNRAFDNRSMVRDEQTLLILIKPKIIIQREYEEAAFPP